MGWLKRVGQIALQIVVGIDTFGPMIKAIASDRVDRVVDVVGDKTRQFVQVIAHAEMFGQALGLTGADKLTAATPAMAQVILSSDAMIGRKIKDPEKFKAGVAQITAGWADILNSLDDNDLPS